VLELTLAAIIFDLGESTVELAWPVLVVVVVLAAVLLFTPYEAVLEGVIAFVLLGTLVAGFLMHPRRDVFYVRTAVPLIDLDRNEFLEQDFLAVRVELVRLWLLFVPTILAVASLVLFAAGNSTQFSFLNWILSSRYAPIAILVLQYPPFFVLLLTTAWVGERRVLRDAAACSATSFAVSRAQVGRTGRVSYAFRGEKGEYYGGDCFCLYLGIDQPHELATIVFHNVRKPELNRIAMAFLFHRAVVLGRGVTDLDKQTVEAQRILAETTS
jgi:hypothetical protein